MFGIDVNILVGRVGDRVMDKIGVVMSRWWLKLGDVYLGFDVCRIFYFCIYVKFF